MKTRLKGFTLIEVLLALAVIAIALTAILRVTSQNINHTQRVKDKSISHWVAMQAVSMIQLNLIVLDPSQESTQVTTMLGQKWYWRAKITSTPVKKIQVLSISTSAKQSGPFQLELKGFRYLDEKK